ncbi:hypothetical protein [Prosthecobacter sp.]|uniref:hypothetical protein n=1 Tax=Prosthecobacter sp. TaxID=1965333 RepID=UPI003783A416
MIHQVDSNLFSPTADRADVTPLLPTTAPQDGDRVTDLLTKINALLNASPSLPFGADYCGLTWSGGFVTVAVYKTGGAGGTTVKTLTFANDGTNYTSITAA